ncbi:MAG: DUF5930 domain-containing protein [Tranquillimonas sp.]|jgi:murein DD-endopeptidase MepM/ murein hydrolase activator NlpD
MVKKRNFLNPGAIVARAFPEKRLYLRTDDSTKYARLSPGTQALAAGGGALVLGWTLVASAMLMMDTVASGDLREQSSREQTMYQERLNTLAAERDARAEEARQAVERFKLAMSQVSQMQSSLLALETRRSELEAGIALTQDKLRSTLEERDGARAQLAALTAEAEGDETAQDKQRLADMETTLDRVTAALGETARQRDEMVVEAREAEKFAEDVIRDSKLQAEKTDRIFAQLEDALTVSVEPLDKMFGSAGLSANKLLDSVRRGYSGQGGPLTPISFSTKGSGPDDDELRANSILSKLDEMNLYRIAAQKAPFAIPVKDAFRYTSGFGERWGRMHYGTDFAASRGTPIYATADGVVTHAGWMNGYGKLVIIQHEFGIETRYAHQSKIRVKVGQRVSRGDRIGDMGNSGNSTGNHLHYEVRVNGKAVNPMTYIKAAKDVF